MGAEYSLEIATSRGESSENASEVGAGDWEDCWEWPEYVGSAAHAPDYWFNDQFAVQEYNPIARFYDGTEMVAQMLEWDMSYKANYQMPNLDDASFKDQPILAQ